jgi:probable HAF family extracellular repeat protein
MIALPLAGAPSLLWSVPAVARRQPAWTQASLADVPDGAIDQAVDINAAGVAVGWSATEAEGISLAVVWREPGLYEALPTLGGPGAEARAINAAGHVAGGAQDSDGNVRPVLWIDGQPTDLGTLGGLNGFAYGLNGRDQVVGMAETRDGAMHPFLWDAGTMTDLADWEGRISIEGLPEAELAQILELAGRSMPTDINEAGQVVGTVGPPPFFTHPVLWQDGEMIDLGTLGGDFAEAKAINDNGQVVGWSRLTVDEPMSAGAGDRGHAFIWEDGELRDLGAPGPDGWSSGNDINATGAIAVNGGVAESDEAAFVLVDGTFIELAPRATAYGINDGGAVVGAIPVPGALDTATGEPTEATAAIWTPAGA